MTAREQKLGAMRVGCSGWDYRSWREDFYRGEPARRWLELYARRFDTVEVNATFYRLPNRSSVARWIEQTPAGFTFVVKASRYLTHVKRLADLEDGAERFYERIEPLAQARRLGPVLWQLPESFARDDDRLAGILRRLPGRNAFEFRHPSWFAEEVYALLREHDAALVIGDHPDRPFQALQETASWHYVRFHHGRKGRRGNYSGRELDAWARRLHAWRSQGEVFAYFNNDREAIAPRNAAGLRARLGRLAEPARGRSLAPVPAGR